jgi:Flp pilus assembly protein TadD
LPAARQAILLNPEDPIALDLMGQALFLLGDLHNAQRFFLRSLSIDPGSALPHLHLGMVYLQKNDPDLAQQQFQFAQQLSTDSAVLDQVERLLGYYFP